ncbi:MAG: NAD-dependent epimerase/dehydratase family protein [Geminicoccaceae bacterium]
MKVVVLGADGYLGWPTCMWLAERGHYVTGIDNYIKRAWEMRCGVSPLWPVPTAKDRTEMLSDYTGGMLAFHSGGLLDHRFIYKILAEKKPDAIIHYAEQPSAPFSMMGRRRAAETQHNNVIGTLNLLFAMQKYCPEAHLIKLGTMGEYGTPNIDIEEGWIDVHHKGRQDRLPFPKQPGSFYHASKVHDSTNILFACRTWGLRATDLNQGVVYGTRTPSPSDVSRELAGTSFHYDAIFGTVLNRFLVQAAVGQPLTVYGSGGQTRGFLHISDTMRCVELTVLNPPEPGEFRVFNQLAQTCSIQDVANLVAKHCDASIAHLPNPRTEAEHHYYKVENRGLRALGFEPKQLIEDHIEPMFRDVQRAVEEHPVDLDVLRPNVKWKMS